MISIHAPGVGCDAVPRELRSHHEISIHAPRVGCDVKELIGEGKSVISIHAPRVGCDLMRELESYADKEFQSTHPVWGATNRCIVSHIHLTDFNPRTPCGVRHIACLVQPIFTRFQSTHPVWGATSAYRVFNPAR